METRNKQRENENANVFISFRIQLKQGRGRVGRGSNAESARNSTRPDTRPPKSRAGGQGQ